MNALADDGMADAEDSAPDADVAPQVGGDRVRLLPQQVPGADEQRSCKKSERGISSGEAGAGDYVLVIAREIEGGDGCGGEQQQRQMMPQQAATHAAGLNQGHGQ